MTTPAWLRDIEARSGTLPVLLVEGEDDRRWFEYFFDHYSPGWRGHFAIFPGEGKQRVFNGMKYHPTDWAGVVDLDEGFPEDIQDELVKYPRVQRLPRFCLESYFIVPEEIWQALPGLRKADVDRDKWEKAIRDEVPAWVAHGAMWRVLRKVYRHSRLPDGLDSEPVTDRAQINKILKEWHESLNPRQVMDEYDKELSLGRALSLDEQMKAYIHGKKFFKRVITNKMDQYFHGNDPDNWMERFQKSKFTAPFDLIKLLDWVLDLFSGT